MPGSNCEDKEEVVTILRGEPEEQRIWPLSVPRCPSALSQSTLVSFKGTSSLIWGLIQGFVHLTWAKQGPPAH